MRSTPTTNGFDPARIRAVIFDYGNTLIPFTHEQAVAMDNALVKTLAKHFGEVDRDAVYRIRERDRLLPYRGDYVENDLAEVTRILVEELYERPAEDHILEELLETRYASFVEAITVPPFVRPLLERLRSRFRLGMISNYPCGRAIRASLDKVELSDLLEAVVVSGDVGHVKPHPKPFQTLCDAMDIQPAEAIYIGDNWLGDIQGAKRFGMSAAYITQYETLEKFDKQEGDHEADVVIRHLEEIEGVMGVMEGGEVDSLTR